MNCRGAKRAEARRAKRTDQWWKAANERAAEIKAKRERARLAAEAKAKACVPTS